MGENYDFNKPPIGGGPVGGGPEFPGNQPDDKGRNSKSPFDDQISKTSLNILASSSGITPEHGTKPKGKLDFGSDEKPEKIMQVIYPGIVHHNKKMNQKSNTENNTLNGTAIIRQKEIELSEKINSMNKAELNTALENPEDLTDDQLDAIVAKLEELLAKEQKQKSDFKNKFETESGLEETYNNQAIKTENNATEKATRTENNATEKAKGVVKVGEQQASALEKEALVFTKDGKVFIPSKASGHVAGVISLGRENGILKASKEILKQFEKGQTIKFEDENGDQQFIKIQNFEELSDDDIGKLDKYIAKNFPSIIYQPAQLTTQDDSKKTDSSDGFSTNKLKDSHSVLSPNQNIQLNQRQINMDNISEIQANLVSKTVETLLDKLKAWEKKGKQLDDKVKDEVEDREIKMDDINRERLINNLGKRKNELEQLKREYIDLKEQRRILINNLKENRNNKNFNVDRATRVKIKEINISIKKYGDLIIKLQKQLDSVLMEIVNENNIQKTSGTNVETRTG